MKFNNNRYLNASGRYTFTKKNMSQLFLSLLSGENMFLKRDCFALLAMTLSYKF